ncbi:MAG: glycoside hydrolase family 2, partial [Verrucomicrobia bacterium]|nr:glycoside hydrolase family 2 [Verrucomicrobiota bacterium]
MFISGLQKWFPGRAAAVDEPRPSGFRPRPALRLLGALALGIAGVACARETAFQLGSGWELQDAAKVADPGDQISRTDYHPAGWLQATVPGTVLTSLVNDGVYPEPLYGENNLKIPDSLCRSSYWYRTTFTVPASWRGRHVWLHFDGINYIAEVWVNGHDVGAIKGAFARGIFDVTADVVAGKPAALAVHILPQPHPGEPHQKTLATGTGRNGGVTAEDGPTFLCSIGWDWIPTIRDRDMGIWQKVAVSASGPVVLQDPYVTSDLPLPRTDPADLTVRVTVHNATEAAQSGTLTGKGGGGIHFRQKISLQPGETRTIVFSPATTPSLRLEHPRLWWPNGYGPQNLYKLRLKFTADGAVSDERVVTFGVRQITYSVPGSDNLTLSVNGVPVAAKGGDWGMDEAMKRIPRARLDAMVRMHQLANYTIIRNWVGQSTSEDFYEMCDKYGLLVWDEFFQPNPADGPNPDDPKLY